VTQPGLCAKGKNMTEEQLRRIDALVAEHIFGWKYIEATHVDATAALEEFPKTTETKLLVPPNFRLSDFEIPKLPLAEVIHLKLPEVQPVPHYSTSIAAAFEIVNGKGFADGSDLHFDKKKKVWQIGSGSDGARFNEEMENESLALLICLWELKAKGVEIK
jgi:hypothetical protein